MNRHERRLAARESKKAAKGADAPAATALYELGRRHMQAGRHLDAQLCCQQALAIDPNHAETLHLMGLLSLQAKQYDHAIEWIARANQQDPSADHLGSLGIALGQQGLHDAAFKALDRAVQLRPDDVGLWIHHGNMLVKLERQAEALMSYQRVLKLDPAHADAAYGCGCLLLGLGRADEALRTFNLCDELRPNQAEVLEKRGLALSSLNRFEEALSDNLRAHALNPTKAATCNDIGTSLHFLSRDEAALAWFDKAIALQPGFMTALVNKGFALTQLQRLDEALATFHQAKALDPGNADLEFHLSLLNLLIGNFEAGWAGREARWRMQARQGSYPQFPQPIWRGDVDIRGKTILVLEDEGLGDTIQFARYIPMLAGRGARVILRVGDPLHPLLSALPDVAACIPKSVPTLPAFDLHCPICSLPLAFGTRLDTIPAAIPYLPAPAESLVQAWEDRLRNRLGPRKGLRVGLAWSGRPTHLNDHNRSIPLGALSRILDVGATFVSLQKDPRPADKAVLAHIGIVDLTSHLTDFAETAALVSCLDLVISVDTSVVHLSGALGRPTWVLLPHAPDWRWLLDRDDSPWYPTVRLFRQTTSGNYESVLDSVRAELVRLVEAGTTLSAVAANTKLVDERSR
jgi:tetratricopeptide (TPR) repeat protein